MVVRPVPQDSMMVNKDKTNSTFDFVSMPMVTGMPVIIDTIATAGMARPMLASAEPKARLRLVCKRFFRAACKAARPSGNSITNATIIPTNDFGTPILTTPLSIVGFSVLASSTTAPSETNNNTRLRTVAFTVGSGV